MEEFDINSDDIMGTSIEILKDLPEPKLVNTQSDTKEQKIVYSNRDAFSDKNNNMQKLIFNLEKDLEVLASDEPTDTPDNKVLQKIQYKANYNDLLDNKKTNNTMNSKKKDGDCINCNILSRKNTHLSDLHKMPASQSILYNEHFTDPIKLNIKQNDYIGIIIFVLIFMVLNNKFIIDLINKISYIKHISTDYPNLIIRSILFGIIIFYYKKNSTF